MNKNQITSLETYLNKYNFQLQNLYMFSILSEDGLSSIDFFAKSHTIPMDSLEVESFPFGLKYYKGYSQVEDFEITFLMPDNHTPLADDPFKFFLRWLQVIYNFEKKCFNVLDNENLKYKNAELILLCNDYETIIDVPTKMPSRKEASYFKPTKGGYLNNHDVSLEYGKSTVITIENLMPLGLGDISVDDETGDPIELTFKFACEGVKIVTGEGLVLKSGGFT